jgi:hypothetical protein
MLTVSSVWLGNVICAIRFTESWPDHTCRCCTRNESVSCKFKVKRACYMPAAQTRPVLYFYSATPCDYGNCLIISWGVPNWNNELWCVQYRRGLYEGKWTGGWKWDGEHANLLLYRLSQAWTSPTWLPYLVADLLLVHDSNDCNVM